MESLEDDMMITNLKIEIRVKKDDLEASFAQDNVILR